MKVSLMTMHRVPNYGSVLQTYATSEVLKDLGHDVEVLDYIPNRLKFWNAILLPLKGKRRVLYPFYLGYSLLVNIPKWRIYNKFLQQNVKLSRLKYYNSSQVKASLPICDVFVTGSDQVWNTYYDGFVDPAFFLDFAPDDRKRIAYAASFGRGELPDSEADVLKPLITRYDKLSVRESSGVEVIRRMGRTDVEHVLDPTFLLDISKWREIIAPRTYKEKFILMYTVNRDEKRLVEFVRKIAQAKGLKIYYLHNGLKTVPDCDRIFRNQTPAEFLSLFSNADYIIATSFHGTAFALNFNKPFISVLPERFQARVESILKLTGLSDRMVSKDFSLDLALKPIDYSRVNETLELERMKSINYLKESLSFDLANKQHSQI